MVHIQVQANYGAVRSLRITVPIVVRISSERQFCVMAYLCCGGLLVQDHIWWMATCTQGSTVGTRSDVEVVWHSEAVLVVDRVQMQVEHVDTYAVCVAHPHISAPSNIVVTVATCVSRFWVSDLAGHI